MLPCTSIALTLVKEKPAPKIRSRLRQSVNNRLFAARQSLYWRIRGFASPGYPGFAFIASTNHANCVELFFCDCMDYR